MEACIVPTGTLQFDESKAFNGYTLYSPMRQKSTYLIDMQGYIVHEWAHEHEPGLYSVLLENGNLLRGAAHTPKYTSHGGEGGGIQEIDWQGRVVWEYVHYRPQSCQHHAFKRLPNGNTLVLCWRRVEWEEARAKGRSNDLIPAKDSPAYAEGLWVNFVEEVSPAGHVVWTWDMWDHAGEAEDMFNINYGVYNKYYRQGLQDWAHLNNVDDVPEYNEILLCSRTFGEFFCVSRETGKITWRFGNPAACGKGQNPGFLNPGDQQLFGPHCATWLGQGRVLLFDNGWMHPLGNRSRMVEVDRAANAIVWQWAAPTGNSFYSPVQSGVQRLPNGNTLACATEHGHFIEVAPLPDQEGATNGLNTEGIPPPVSQGKVVWEYINPMTRVGARPLLTESTHTESANTNSVHRAHRYAPDYPGLAGKDLSKRRPFMAAWPEGPWRAWGQMLRSISGQ